MAVVRLKWCATLPDFVTLRLTSTDNALLNGDSGAAAAFAMAILTAFSRAVGAAALLDISQAHIDGCLYHGQVNLDFVERLVEGRGRVRVPTTLNVGAIDLIHPELIRLSSPEQAPGRRLMKAHESLGCEPSFTCAPYHTKFRPSYGDFIDLCCAMTGRAPAWGLHLDAPRLGQVLFELTDFPASLEPSDGLYVAVGLLVGSRSGDRIPVINGLPAPHDEDLLKALGAAAASSGAVGLFHAIGITPEAPTLRDAFGGRGPEETIVITPDDVKRAVQQLSTVPEGAPLTAVCLGTPHFSRDEWDRFLPILRQAAPARGIPIYVNTGRATLAALEREGLLTGAADFHLIIVTDTCTYLTPILERMDGTVMTNSGKWAHYAPGNLGVQVAFGDLADCVASAATGHVVRSRAW